MRNTLTRAAILLAALAPMAVFGAGPRRAAAAAPGNAGTTARLLRRTGAGGPGFMEPVEPARGAPFKAQSVDEHTQTLSDGNRIARKTTASLWRDGEGRTRREMDGRVLIDDPVAGTGFVLDPETKTAMQRPSFPGHRPPDGGGGARHDKGDKEEPPGGKASQPLGTRTIEGLEATGTRHTLTIPAGEIGNEKPIEVVSERWYSPELQAVVLSTHRDPRTGQDTHRLTGITRGEPDKSLFEVPEGFTVRQGPPPFRGPRPGRPQDQQ